MKKNLLLSLIIGLLFAGIKTADAQSLTPVTFSEKVGASSLIVEGRVAEQTSFWNPEHTMILTSNTIVVSKIFKGSLEKNLVEVMTVGGTVDGQAIHASELLHLEKGDFGMFFCAPTIHRLKSPTTGNTLLDIYSSAQGFLKYNEWDQSAHAPFAHYSSIEQELYTAVTKQTGLEYRSLESKNSQVAPISKSGVNVLGITGFSPSTVYAGALNDPTNNILTITGTDFGTATGSAAVYFDDANDGAGGSYTGVSATSPYIISWTNTSIQVRVPGGAGTGSFIVMDASGATTSSPSTLTVLYNVTNIAFSSGTVIREANLMNDNGSGGYSIQLSSSTTGSGVNFDTSPAKATLERAVNTWRETAGINFSISATTTATQTVQSDGVNLAVFDNTNAGTGVTPLPNGVLAVCYSYYAACNPVASTQPQVTEFDIIVRNTGVSTGSVAFNLGPCPPMSSSTSEYDMETVMLHELGHAIQLGHINDSHQGTTNGQRNPGKLMNYAIVNSVKRVSPDYSAQLGALYLATQEGNTYGGPCGLATAEMTPLARTIESKDDCPASFPVTALSKNTSVNFDLVHTTSNRFVDPNYTQVTTTGVGVGVTNTAYYAFRTNNVGGSLDLSVAGYTTTPSTPTSCATPFGYLTKGVELALYQVSSCPTGQAFPTPIARLTFDGDGALTTITGLAANTSYLLLADGIENTKANFNLTFTGAALLPINFDFFNGIVLPKYNQLNWSIDQSRNVLGIAIERSSDGILFSEIGQSDAISVGSKTTYTDLTPLPGNNFYRLAVKNMDGTIEYSKIVLLKREENLTISIQPNPANSRMLIQLKTALEGRYLVNLFSSNGQLIASRTLNTAGNQSQMYLETSSVKSGLYYVSIYDPNGKLIATRQTTIQH